MQSELTEHAIEKMLKEAKMQKFLVQVYKIERRQENIAKMMLSDGFVQFKTMSGNFPKEVKDFDVIEVLDFTLMRMESSQTINGIQLVKVERNCQCDVRIGNPMPYKQYIQKERNNPNGSRIVPVPEKKQKQPKPEGNSVQNQPQNKQQQNQQSQPKQEQPNEQINAKSLKSLSLGTDFTILVRVLYIFPVKNITSNGRTFSVMNIEVGDNTDTIILAVFGEEVEKHQSCLHVDQIYLITGVKVTQKVRDRKTVKMYAITSESKVIHQENGTKIRSFEDFAVSIDELAKKQVGESVKVICLVKDNQQSETFPNQSGGASTRKRIIICDPERRKELEITLWNEKAQLKWSPGPYFFRDVVMGQYRKKKQFELSRFDFYFKKLPEHRYAQYLGDFQKIKFENPIRSEIKKDNDVSNLADLQKKSRYLQSDGVIWTEGVFNIKDVKATSQKSDCLVYFSCKNCKKKVQERMESTCAKCDASYTECNYQYGFSLEIFDSSDSIWVNVFNSAAERIIEDVNTKKKLIAEDIFKMDHDQQIQVIENLKTLRFKFVVKSFFETFNGFRSLKHLLISVEEIRQNLEGSVGN